MNPAVDEWIADTAVSELHLTATVIAEMIAGIVALPIGRRRQGFQDDFDRIVGEDYAGRILPFDVAAARAYGHVHEARRRRGRPIQIADAQIAAVCLVHDAALATRNTGDFEGLGIALVDPWRPA